MLARLGQLSASRPRRTLVILLCFVAVAAVVGGPVAGQLESGDGFRTKSSESSRADRQFARATGEHTSPGVVLIVRGPASGLDQRARTAADTLEGLPGVAETTPVATAQDGRSALVAGSLRADADEEEVAEAAITVFHDNDDVGVGGWAVSNLQLGETISGAPALCRGSVID